VEAETELSASDKKEFFALFRVASIVLSFVINDAS
jgi:hypothetical protein